jgi:hypothetical protein
MEIGTGHWNQIMRVPVDPDTGEIFDQEVRALLEFAVSDVCDTFAINGDYIYVICTYSHYQRREGPLVTIWDKETFAYVHIVEFNFGLYYPTDGATLTRHLIPNSAVAGDFMYFYGTTLQMYGDELPRFALIGMFDTENWLHGCAYT